MIYGLNLLNYSEENMSLADWKIDDLKKWDDKICKLALEYGLDWFPISYEVCDYFEMIG